MDHDTLNSPSRSVRIDNDYPTRAVLLAAGKGRRLEPVTIKTPKPLLKVGGRSLIEKTLRALQAARVIDVCIVVNHLAEQIVEYVSAKGDWGMSIHFVHQEEILGTADALRTAVDFLDQPCFVLAADYALPRGILLPLKDLYQSESADMVISLKEVPGQEVSYRSTVRLDMSGRIVELLEKPRSTLESKATAASLIYILPPEIALYLSSVGLSKQGEYELPEVINLMIMNGYAARGLLQDTPLEWSAGS
jgi:NDP-sugar pyrophosphorylase family protein